MNSTLDMTDEIRNVSEHLLKTIEPDIPFLKDYYEGINGYIILAMAIGGLLFFINFGVFFHTVSEICGKVKKEYQSRTLLLCGIYPVVSTAAFVTLLVPESYLVCNTVMHMSFTVCAFIFYQLCLLYVNGEENFLKNVEADALDIKTPPLCCCCMCFKPMTPTKERLYVVRWMILQLPIFQFLIVLALNVIYIQEPIIYYNTYLYFAPFMFVSIMIGLWGLNIFIKMFGTTLTDYNLRLKYMSLQFVLVFCKLQTIILENALRAADFGGRYPITNTVYSSTIMQVLILVEMCILSFLAKKAYKKPILS